MSPQCLDPQTPGAPGTPLGRQLARGERWRRAHGLGPSERRAVLLTSLLWIWVLGLVGRWCC